MTAADIRVGSCWRCKLWVRGGVYVRAVDEHMVCVAEHFDDDIGAWMLITMFLAAYEEVSP